MSRGSDPYRRLVTAVLATGELATANAREWERLVALDDVNRCSVPLLPMLYASMAGQPDRLRDHGRLHGVARHAWLRAAQVETRLDEMGAALMARGIDSVPAGGASRRRFYSPSSSRSLADAALLVRPGNAAAAITAVVADGWRPFGADLDRPHNQRLAAFAEPREGVEVDQGAAIIDLHWRVGGPRFDADDDGAVWARASDSGLAPPDELLHTVLHGPDDTRRRCTPWLVDGVRIAQQLDDPGWDSFATSVERRALQAVAVDRLGQLAAATDDAHLGTIVPSWVHDRLRIGISRAQRIEQVCRARLPVGLLWFRYRRETRATRRRPTPLGFLAWLRTAYDLTGPRDLNRRVRRSRHRD